MNASPVMERDVQWTPRLVDHRDWDNLLKRDVPEQEMALLPPDPLPRLGSGFGPNTVVGLHGVAQSGKDTAAAYLRTLGWNQVVLAAPILEALLLLDPIVTADRYGREYRFREVYEAEGYESAKKTPEFRRLMQAFGTEVGREHLSKALGMEDGIWLEIAKQRLRLPGQHVISDVRFTDEVGLVQSFGGLNIKIKRPGYGPINSHASDAGLPDEMFDAIIVNSGTIEDLHHRLHRVIRNHGITLPPLEDAA